MTVPVVLLAAVLATAGVSGDGVQGTETSDCTRTGDASARIAACTEIINTGGLLGGNIARAYHMRAIAYRDARDYENAIDDFDAALGMSPDSAGILFERAGTYMSLGEYDHAIADYDASLAFDPGNPSAYFMRGVSHNQLGESPQAVLDYNAALKLDPDAPPVYNERAWAYYLMGDYGNAMEDADRALAMRPHMAPALDTRAHVLAATGQPDKALEDFEKAIHMGGRGFVLMYQRALAEHGFFSGETDGVYAEGMRAALVACLREQCRLLK